MAENNMQRNDEETRSRGGNQGSHNNFDNGPESKFEKLYNVIDAFIDTVDLPVNRSRAIKYGMRALGELVSEYQETKHHTRHEDDSEKEGGRSNRNTGPARG